MPRIEKDSMGEMNVPDDALYGAQTRRAELNFPVSGWRMPTPFVSALARIKRIAANVNRDLGRLDANIAKLIADAAREVEGGQHDRQFVVDVFQTGSGTSTNMNANEVIANRAIQLAGGEIGSKHPVHPNDHVNLGQSSNDAIPTALHVSVALALTEDLLPALRFVHAELEKKSWQFAEIIKLGRTHLQDATPVTLGQVFGGYAAQVVNCRERLNRALTSLYALPLGGTAVGTGLNTHPDFAARVCKILADETSLPFYETENHFEGQSVRDASVETAAMLKTVAVSLTKIANDLRFLASGPRCGYGELLMPSVQPGSSIMPGKVNPVICESLMQAAAYVVGADASITFSAGILSNFELAVNIPLVAYQLLESIRLLANACRMFSANCLQGIEADEELCAELVEKSLAMCTSLAPLIGYDQAAAVAKEAYHSNRTIREVMTEKQLLPPEKLNEALDPGNMLAPQ
jgi:fumarate hydratase class II